MSSVRLGKVMGISLELHSTFVILMVMVVALLALFDLQNLVPTLILFFFLFLSVFIHELFHSMVAISKGVKVSRILLLPIGGVAFAEDLPEKPIDELLMAIAGPAFNFAVAFLIFFLVSIFPFLPWPHGIFSGAAAPELLESAILSYPLFALFWVNMVLGMFNLFIPAMPLDGGRVLRALLSMKLGNARATMLAAKLSMFLAIVLGVIGFFFNWLLAIIAIFIYVGANAESQAAAIKETMRGVDFMHIVNRKPPVLEAALSLEDATEEMEKLNDDAFLVQIGRNYGYITAEMVASVKRHLWPVTTVRAVAKRVPAAKPSTSSGKVISAMMSKGYPFIAIVDRGVLIGVVEADEINKLYKLSKLDKGLY